MCRWRKASALSGGRRVFRRKDARGFTLVELMITVAIIAILAAIALPSYRKYMLRSNRDAAENVMLDMGSAEERYMIDNRSYAATAASVGYPTMPDTVVSNYRIVPTVNAGTPPGFTITATPIGGQLADTTCAVLTYKSDGTKLANNTSQPQCWR